MNNQTIKSNTKPTINCAIYTRKSCEEGLEQEFNSLDSQYEASKAYITSQKHEGWKLYKRYDDGGYSGGNIERPALKQLMQDIENNIINCIVVYKVDRLSRSISDFFKLMETFDKHNISFVSVTQSFNTTNSMGKLTLNILLSFAQFEREVTSERIRDKISASKKKGMWLGGFTPIGYDITNKKLIINTQERESVNYIFNKYLELKSINKLKQHLNNNTTIRTKQQITKENKQLGNNKWQSSGLNRLLRNYTYIGKINYKNNIYQGEHEAIIDEDIFNQVQEILTNQNQRNTNKTTVGKYLLYQKLYNQANEIFKCDACIKTNKKTNTKVKYHYYTTTNKRLQCYKIDKQITETIKQLISSSHNQLFNNQLYLSTDNQTINIIINTNTNNITSTQANKTLIKAIATGYKYKKMIEEQNYTITQISKQENKQGSYINRITLLGYLSPKITEHILQGKHKEELTIMTLERISKASTNWKEQEKMFEELR